VLSFCHPFSFSLLNWLRLLFIFYFYSPPCWRRLCSVWKASTWVSPAPFSYCTWTSCSARPSGSWLAWWTHWRVGEWRCCWRRRSRYGWRRSWGFLFASEGLLIFDQFSSNPHWKLFLEAFLTSTTHTPHETDTLSGFVRSWKTWKSCGICKLLLPGLEKNPQSFGKVTAMRYFACEFTPSFKYLIWI